MEQSSGAHGLQSIGSVVVMHGLSCSEACGIFPAQFRSAAQSCPTLCDPMAMDFSRPGLPVHHQFPELTQTHVHWVGDDIQPSHPLLPPSPPAFNLPRQQGLFQWVSSLHQVAKVLELQLQSFQWLSRVDFLKDWLVWSPHCPRDSQESSQQTPVALSFINWVTQ